ncbi:M16 family metallopeptidase [Leptonema illini]|uniref:Peptidase M16 domain protein n=1 Tax=Leptonema illini DSM 21528 TaxID=929563 RepID=H2CDG6_9LEPT|nr:pitrilysin family protein [Leptonema illini]EHQ06499.1 peptidase M16 domain protein [Leptonema illini DSM 21528]
MRSAFPNLTGRLALAALLLLLPATILPEKKMTPTFQTLLDRSRRFTLPNGLRVVFLQRGDAPVAALYLKIRAGGSDESPEDTGIAHMLEHMLFKGTKIQGTLDYEAEARYLEIIDRWAMKYDRSRRELEAAQADRAAPEKIEELTRRVEKWRNRMDLIQSDVAKFRVPDEDSLLYSLNGERGYNAYTNRDLTSYLVELPSNRIEVWARIESDRFKNPVLREFYTERDVVSEERRMRVENVGSSLLMEKFLEEVYGDHPYGPSLIGPMEKILYFNRPQAARFYQEHYGPDNAVIAVVGRFDEAEVKGLIEKYFGDWQPRKKHGSEKPGSKHDTIPEAKPQLRRVDVDVRHPGSPAMFMAWFKPPFPHTDDLKLEVLARILAGSEETRLYRRLVLKDKIAAAVNIYSGFPGERYTNMFFLSAVPVLPPQAMSDEAAVAQGYDRIEMAVFEEIERIVREGVTDEEVSRVKKGIATELVQGFQSNGNLADSLTYYETITGDYRDTFLNYDKLNTITAADVKAVAAQYLKRDIRMMGRLLPPPAQNNEAPANGEKEAR